MYKNCDTETAPKYFEDYSNFHGIPRSKRCDQAQAFKAREFEIYCKVKNIKLILAPAGDHRATGMVERLIQTIKRRIAIMQSKPLWSNADLAEIVAKIIQSIRLIPNSVTKIKPFEAHFGRPPNTELSNIIIKPHITRLTYNKIRSFVSDKTKLKHPALPREAIWDLEQDSEPELDIQYKDEEPSHSAVLRALSPDSSDSENAPLLSHTRVPGRFTPSKLQITFDDKTSTIIYNKKNIARKTIARKINPTTRGSLKPQWNNIPDGTKTNYSPHKITLDTNNRKNTVIRNSDLAIVTQTLPKPSETITNNKPRLKHMVACKTVNEYHSNQRKLRRIYLEEQAARAAQTMTIRPNSVNREPLGHSDILKMAKANQRKQAQQTKAKPNPKGRRKKAENNRATTFPQKSKEAAIKHRQQTRSEKRKLLYSSSSENKSFAKATPSKIQPSSTIRTFNIRESPAGPNFMITASPDPNDFMNPPSDPSTIPGPSKARSTPRVDKILERIWKHNSPNKQDQNDNPIKVVYLDSTNSTGKQSEEVITLESTPNEDNLILEAEPLDTNKTEEHEGGHQAPSRTSNRETFITHQNFEDKTLLSGEEGGVCYGGIPEGTPSSHVLIEIQSLGIATKHLNLLL